MRKRLMLFLCSCLLMLTVFNPARAQEPERIQLASASAHTRWLPPPNPAKAETPPAAESSLGIHSSWIGSLKLNHTSAGNSRAAAGGYDSAAAAYARLASRLLMPVQANPIKIVSPKQGDRFALRQMTIIIQVDSTVNTLQLLITNADNKIVYDSGAVTISDRTKPWTTQVELSPGVYSLTARGFVTNGGVSEDTVTNVTQVEYNPDDRSTFEASAYVGYGVDSFAASDLRTYLNPEASGDVEVRFVGGFDFAYRLPLKSTRHQLWIYGETVHGVRSAEVDCTANPNHPLCQDLLNGQNPGQQLSFILREATSLEAFAGIRWEFAALNIGSDAPARAYLKTQFGYLTVAGLGGDVVDLHEYIGLGLTATRGNYRNSYVEIGFGKSDFFLDNKNKRWKIDGFLSWGSASTSGLTSMMRPFAQMTVDSDFGKGSDSIQVYFGIDFDLAVLWRKSP